MHNEFPPSSRMLRRLEAGPREGSARHAVERQLNDGCFIALALDDPNDPRSVTVTREAVAIAEDGTEEKFTCKDRKPHYSKNYAVVAPFGPFAPKLLLHGRELLPTKALADKLEAGAFEGEDWNTVMRPQLTKKVSRLFANDTLDERLMAYAAPRDVEGLVQSMLEHFRQTYPQMDLSDLPAITESNLAQVMGQLMLKAEKMGADSVDMFSQLRHPQAEIKAKVLEHIKAGADASYDAIVHASLTDEAMRQEAMRRKPEVMEYAARHGHDPEIAVNYVVGLGQCGDMKQPLADIIEIGLGFRTGAVIAQAARSLDNPYKPLFLDAEKKVARVIATSVQPRAVTNAMKREMAFLVTDAASIMPFNDALAMPTPGYWGKHELFQALNSNVFTDMIAVSSPGLEPKRMAWLLRHETEHSVDLSHRMSFAELYKDSLKEALADDRAEFDALYHMVEKITPKSHPVEIRKMQKLAKLLKLEDAENPRLSADALMKMKDRVEHMLAAVNGRFGSFAPHTPGNTHVSYQLKTCMLAEVPAVIEELNGVLGQPFVKEVLPRLYEASRMHRSLHPHFREDAKARREQAAIPTSRA